MIKTVAKLDTVDILLFWALAILMDGVTTFTALSMGLVEANPIAIAITPQGSLLFRAAAIIAVYFWYQWRGPITVVKAWLIMAAGFTWLIVASNTVIILLVALLGK